MDSNTGRRWRYYNKRFEKSKADIKTCEEFYGESCDSLYYFLLYILVTCTLNPIKNRATLILN